MVRVEALIPMLSISLAPWNYRRLIHQINPIISKLSYRAIQDHWANQGLDGCARRMTLFEAYAYLNEHLKPHGMSKSIFYGDADGTGTARYKNQAGYKAISEALERWCFYEIMNSSRAKQFGFHIEPSTLGLAAFPGIGHRLARSMALQEAIERWSVCAWWEGLLPARRFGWKNTEINAVRVLHPWCGISGMSKEVVLLWAAAGQEKNDFTVYGFACASSIEEAITHAQDEMRRNRDALMKAWNAQNVHPRDVGERRLLFFSTQKGHELFIARLQKSEKILETQPKILSKLLPKLLPKLLIDQEIRGPWSQYAKVWRLLFEMPTDRHLLPTDDYFLF